MAKNNKIISQSIELSVIIVNYNTVKLLENCLFSVFQTSFPHSKLEVIVVDNASVDNSIDMMKQKFPRVNLIQNTENLGFAKANNIGIRIAKGKYILLLNSDTEVPEDVFSKMSLFNEKHKSIGASTCKLILQNGQMDPACHRGFPTPLNSLAYFIGLENVFPHHKICGGYHLTYLNLNSPHEIDCISGAFFWVPRDVIDKVGMLDEDFFMYGEDIDWAYRIKKAGFQIWFNPEVVTYHFKKQSGRNNLNKHRRINTEIMFHENNQKFYRKHYEQIYPKTITYLIYLFYGIRIFLLKKFHI
jgi:GT2 family glycosyltransferase